MNPTLAVGLWVLVALAPLHTTGTTLHVLTEVGLALLGVAAGIALVVGAFTLFHEWLSTSR